MLGWLLGDDDDTGTHRTSPTNRVVAPDDWTTSGPSDRNAVEIIRNRQPEQPVELSQPINREQVQPERMYVTASRLNIRSLPGTEHPIIGKLVQNAAITVTTSNGPWRYVTNIPNPGWVHGDYLTSARPVPRQPTQPRAVSGPSDSEIVQILIRQSIARYSGSCPCPYNTDRGGRRCGGRSAHSRPGGASPLCFPGDVTPQMIARYRARQ
ncbi:MAG: SH3 domain-containing protein [Hyphomicrobiales bacterium]